jgi:hypothetical protein
MYLTKTSWYQYFYRKGASRYLTVYKREGSSIVQADAVFQLVQSSRQHVYALLHKFPLTNKERQELLPLTERDRMLNPEGEKFLLWLCCEFLVREVLRHRKFLIYNGAMVKTTDTMLPNSSVSCSVFLTVFTILRTCMRD